MPRTPVSRGLLVAAAALAAVVSAPHAAPAGAAPATRAAAAPIVRPAGTAAAREWVATRRGTVSFAVLDDRLRLRGEAPDRAYPSASLSKAMLLLAVVRSARDRDLTRAERRLLEPMVRRSSNKAANVVYALVGAPGLLEVARAAGMRGSADAVSWPSAQVTPADQVRLFRHLDALLPPRHQAYARGLLAGIVARQRWGAAPVAEARGMRILFKSGWRRALTTQAARGERHGRRAALSVMVAGGPSRRYDAETIRGVAALVLAE